jgi:hypothetical protein
MISLSHPLTTLFGCPTKMEVCRVVYTLAFKEFSAMLLVSYMLFCKRDMPGAINRHNVKQRVKGL